MKLPARGAPMAAPPNKLQAARGRRRRGACTWPLKLPLAVLLLAAVHSPLQASAGGSDKLQAPPMPSGNTSSGRALPEAPASPGVPPPLSRARISMSARAAPGDIARTEARARPAPQPARSGGPMINGELATEARASIDLDGAGQAHAAERAMTAVAAAAAASNKLAGRLATRSSGALEVGQLRRGRRRRRVARAAAAAQLIDNNNNKLTAARTSERRQSRHDDAGESHELTEARRTAGAGTPQLESGNKNNNNNNNNNNIGDPAEPDAELTSQAEVAGSAMEANGASAGDNNKLKCRVEKDLYLDFEEYRHYTCANCYNQVPPEYFKNKLALARLEERVVKLRDRDTDKLVWSNESARIRDTFKDEEKFVKWRICCHEAVVCCHLNARHLPMTRNELGRLIDDPRRLDECPGTWDGLSCWPASPAGQLAWRTCPRVAYLLDFEPACRGYVTKQCFPNASWFINRNGHEWSDYSTCSPEGLYKARMLHAAVAYVCEALIVTPALLIIGKFPNRGGNKRIRIMKSLLFYILMNSLIQALQRGFLAAGFFAEYRAGPARVDHHAQAKPGAQPTSLVVASNTTEPPPAAASLLMLANASTSGAATSRVTRSSALGRGALDDDDDDDQAAAAEEAPDWAEEALIGRIFPWKSARRNDTKASSKPEVMRASAASIRRRLRRNVTSAAAGRQGEVAARGGQRDKRSESAWKAIFCWLLQMASRLVRLMGYAWMFTGGVYLCSALHFAPAEPPVKFIKILFFLTNAFPNLIFFAYVTARTINEPSPLNILLKAPYYWLQGDHETVAYLCSTQKVCWFEESKSEQIENIADLPNLILVASNVILFVITLVILCRINRPGSTRPDTSPCAYFKAAGTLLFLYGGHYFFLAYRPESESCSVDTFMFYAFICIDVVQGIAISIVFCYMTQEGKTVISKYWRTRQRFLLVRQFTWMGCLKDKDKFAENGYHHSALHTNSRFNQSTRSNQSGCNGHNDNMTEFININDAQVTGHF